MDEDINKQENLTNSNHEDFPKSKLLRIKLYIRIIIIMLVLSVLSLFGALVFPHTFKRYLRTIYNPSSYLDNNNFDFWSEVPGKLNTLVTHKFNVFDIISSEDFSKIQVKYNDKEYYEVKETGAYGNYKFNDRLKKVSAQKQFSFDEIINNLPEMNHFDPVILETITSITNVPLHQLSISAFQSATGPAFAENLFLKIFSVYCHKNVLSNKELTNAWLSGFLSKDKVESILNGASSYSWKEASGFYNWVSLIDDNSKIPSATWLTKEFNLNEKEIQQIVGDASFLNSQFAYVNFKYSEYLNCSPSSTEYSPCTNEQINFAQITNSGPILLLNIDGIETVSDLTSYLKIAKNDKYEEEPEMIYFFKKHFSQRDKTTYDKVSLSNEQSNIIFQINNKNSILRPENSLSFLMDYLNSNIYNSYTKIKIKSNFQFDFLAEYFFKYCPINFSILKFKDNNNAWIESDGYKKAYTRLLIDAIKIYRERIKSNIRYIYLSKSLYSYSVADKLTCESVLKDYASQSDITKICITDKALSFNDYYQTKLWVKPYECNYAGCKDKEIKIFANLTGIKEDDIKKLYSDEKSILVEYFKKIETAMKTKYNCPDTKCSALELSNKQFLLSSITKNPIDIITSSSTETLFDWDKVEFTVIPEYYSSTESLKDETNILSIDDESNFYSVYRDIFFYLYNKGYKGDNLKAKYSFFVGVEQINEVIAFFNRVSKYLEIKPTKVSLSDILFGKNYSPDDYMNYGSPSEGFLLNKEKTNSIIDIKLINKKDKIVKEEDIVRETLDLNTGNLDLDPHGIRNITKINSMTFYNTKYPILNYDGSYSNQGLPLYFTLETENKNMTLKDLEESNVKEGKSRTKLRKYITDGFQFSNEYFNIKDNQNLYYYDSFSKRIIAFEQKEKMTLTNGLECIKYTLKDDFDEGDDKEDESDDEEDEDEVFDFSNGYYEQFSLNYYKSGKAFASMFTNFLKPYSLSSSRLEHKKTIFNIENQKEFEKENSLKSYMCVDENSFVVLESQINLMYSVDLSPLRVVLENKGISLKEKNNYVPLLNYQRKSTVDYNKYIEVFPKVRTINNISFASLVVFYILLGIFILTALFSAYKYFSLYREN